MSELRPFRVSVPDQALADVQARLADIRWTPDLFEEDWRYGAPVPFVRALCDHWRTAFDWRALEARINQERQFVTEIDGLTIHTVARQSSRADATPLLLMHGWPSAFTEFLGIYEPLAEPPSGAPAFHVVTPSLPGYAFSTTRLGLAPRRIGAMMVALMERLGYRRFMIQGGNWGAVVGGEIARDYPDRVIGLHLNSLSGALPADKESLPLTDEERAWMAAQGPPPMFPHFAVLSQTPASLAHTLNDSPAGLAAWIGERLHDWSDSRTMPSVDRMVGIIALYWFTQSIGSSGLLYHEVIRSPVQSNFVTVPTAGAIFPKGLLKLPRSWAAQLFNIMHWQVFDRGGHFPAMEVPSLLADDLRSFAKTLLA